MPFTLNLTALLPLAHASADNMQMSPCRLDCFSNEFDDDGSDSHLTTCFAFAAEAGGGVHGVPAVATRHAPEDHRVLRTSLPRQILRRRRHLGRAVGEVTRGTSSLTTP